MKKIIFINGKFLCQRITGVQRFAFEITKRIDEINDPNFLFKLIVPSKEFVKNTHQYKNIEIVYTKGKPNYFWEQITLARYCKKNKPFDLLNLCNIAPIRYPGSCVIHDLGCIDAKNGFSKKQVFIYKFINRRNVKKYKHIFTVSYCMKQRIEEYYKVKNVQVIYNGYEHFNNVVVSKPKFDLPNKYYFAVGSMNPNKNFVSIIKMAHNNPNERFYIAGGSAKNFKKLQLDIPQNVIFTGYLEDSELAYLYKNCFAFLFPSLYEGFGIPPLEALVLGCKTVICNDIPVLKEVYHNFAVFIDYSCNVDLSKIPSNPNLDLTELKNRFNWEKSAKNLVEVYRT